MKNKYLLPIVAFLSSCCLAGCTEVRICLTYGTYINHTPSTLKELDNDELYNRLFEKEENLLLAVYQGAYSEDCLCWSTFENVISNYINKYHEMIYVYNAQNIEDSLKQLDILKLEKSTPALYVFKGRRQIISFSYDKNRDRTIFEDLDGELLNKRIHQYVEAPKIYYVNRDYLDKNIKENNEFIVSFFREACGDCSYIMPNVILPYIESRKLRINFWIFDMQKDYELSKNSTDEEEKEHYNVLKNHFHLSASSDPNLGYLGGVVPTIQYYKNGQLVDACVYFNDTIDKRDGVYYISDSFYTEERLPHLHYTDMVLKGLELNEDEVIQTKSGFYYWSQDKAALKHNAIATSFLDMYLSYLY
ncbi:MAG TPA: hypothetical protein GX010_04155 [Erysipelotrichaceae bacterium]|nr:hypothetical protein [Erysipelotrichaceae bacterium]